MVSYANSSQEWAKGGEFSLKNPDLNFQNTETRIFLYPLPEYIAKTLLFILNFHSVIRPNNCGKFSVVADHKLLLFAVVLRDVPDGDTYVRITFLSNQLFSFNSSH